MLNDIDPFNFTNIISEIVTFDGTIGITNKQPLSKEWIAIVNQYCDEVRRQETKLQN